MKNDDNDNRFQTPSVSENNVSFLKKFAQDSFKGGFIKEEEDLYVEGEGDVMVVGKEGENWGSDNGKYIMVHYIGLNCKGIMDTFGYWMH
ncbi:hypothetical protein DERP_005336, partial [Dermatophagoides pteronyssinus]